MLLKNLSDVYIDDLLFVGCINNYIKSVTQFTITNSTFDGQYGNGTALFITNNNANISKILSVFYCNRSQYYESRDPIFVGGAIYGNNSDISISDSVFEENMAQLFGAVVAIEKKSKLAITDTKFHQNQTYLQGRGVYADNDCKIAIVNGSFFENNVDAAATLIQIRESNLILCFRDVFSQQLSDW